MDSLTDRSFMDLFQRMTAYVDLKGCETQEDIEQKMISAIKFMRRARDRGKKPSTRKKWGGRIKLIRTLGRDGVPAVTLDKIRMGFARRTAEYAEIHARSRLALTLQYGKKTAKKILRKRLLKRIKTLARKERQRKWREAAEEEEEY